MTRIFVPRGSGSSSSNQNRPPPPSSQPQSQPSSTTPPSSSSSSVTRDEDQEKDSNLSENEIIEQSTEEKQEKNDNLLSENEPSNDESTNSSQLTEAISSIHLSDNPIRTGSSQPGIGSSQVIGSASYPPPPPVPPPNPSSQLNTTTNNSNLRRLGSGGQNSSGRIGSSRRSGTRGPQQPSSPRSISESDGYNSADELGPCPKPSNYADAEREHMFEVELRRVKGFEIRRMLPDGNCLFRSVADQVYGDPEAYDVARHMCVDYMERERDHFSQFITEGFTSYCRRKRRDKVYGNNMEIQAFAEMYNRPIHIYSYSTEPINIFQGSYNTDTPPIRLSYHHGNHYNSLVDPRRLGVGVGLGFSTLRGVNADRDQVKAAIKAQQDHQIDNALIAEGRFYSDMELTEKEIERMVMEASRAEYLKQQQQQHSFTSGAEPSSSATIIGSSNASSGERVEENNNNNNNNNSSNNKLTGNMRQLMAMGFSYVQVIEAHSIFGDDVDSMICYLLETGTSSGDNRRKGKAAE